MPTLRPLLAKQFIYLLSMSQRRVVSKRIQHWTAIVNEAAASMLQQLAPFLVAQAAAQCQELSFKGLDSAQYLGFVANWNGVGVVGAAELSNYNQFLQRAQTWLNEQRPAVYAASLFADMVRFAANVCRASVLSLLPSDDC